MVMQVLIWRPGREKRVCVNARTFSYWMLRKRPRSMLFCYLARHEFSHVRVYDIVQAETWSLLSSEFGFLVL